jgi:hypothetical protein
METKDNIKNGTFENIKRVFQKSKPDFTAEYAWLETTYGAGTFRSLEQRIKEKQDFIRNLIKSKFPSHDERYRPSNTTGSYRCVVDIEEDLVCCVNDVFKPFIDGGFKIINLSEQIKEIEGENVYLISWKTIFKENVNKKKTLTD